MTFVTVRDLRSKPKSVWETLEKEREVIVTINGKPSALMLPIDEDELDDVLALVRQINAAKALNRMQIAAVQAGLSDMSLEDINAEISQARKEASR